MKIILIVALVAMVSGLTGIAIASIGDTSPATTYHWLLPFEMFFVMAIPALLGYLIGREG